MQEALFLLLADAGIEVKVSGRGYRPALSLPGFEAPLPEGRFPGFGAGLGFGLGAGAGAGAGAGLSWPLGGGSG